LGHSSAAEKLVRAQWKEIALGWRLRSNNPKRKNTFSSVGGAGPDGMIVYSLDLDLKARLASWRTGGKALAKFSATIFAIFRIVIAIKNRRLPGHRRRTKKLRRPFQKSPPTLTSSKTNSSHGPTTQSGFRYLSYCPSLWTGNLRGTEGVHFHKADAILCEPLDKNPLYAQVDGENRSPASPSNSKRPPP